MMATPALSFNPMLTTNAGGLFEVQTDGFIQGTVMDDPAVRFALAGGILASTETIPMFGGVGIFENTPAQGTGGVTGALGSSVGRATSLSLTASNGLAGFSTFNQATAWMTSPQNPVPVGSSGMTVPFFRLGSGARVAVQCAAGLAAALAGNPTGQQVSWDFTNQQLTTYVASFPANVITAASWASTSGGQATLTTTTAHGVAVGDNFTISGVTPSAYNGDFVAITGTTGSTLVYALPLASTPGAGTAFGTLVAGGGALACRILRVNVGNSKTVNWDPVNLVATWNPSGNAALILI